MAVSVESESVVKMAVYVEAGTRKALHDLFDDILDAVVATNPRATAGVLDQNLMVETPDGRRFYGFTVKGEEELVGRVVDEVLVARGLVRGEMSEAMFRAADSSWSLRDCRVTRFSSARGDG